MKFIVKQINVNCTETESFFKLPLAHEIISVTWTDFRRSASTKERAEGEKANISFAQNFKSLSRD